MDVFSKHTNSFNYVIPSTCLHRRNIKKVPEGVDLRWRQICDTFCKLKIRSHEYQQYLIARGYKTQKGSKQFSDIVKISRQIVRKPRVKMNFKVPSFVTEFNSLLTDLNRLIRNRLSLLHSDTKMKMVFPEKSIRATYRRGKNLKEILSPSSFPSTKNLIVGSISNCNKRCDIWTNFMVFDTTFKSTATGNYYKAKGTLSCNSVNVVYLITCQCCKL